MEAKYKQSVNPSKGYRASQVALVGKEPTCQCRRRRRFKFNPGSGRYPGGGNVNLLQYSCLESSTDRGTWQATAHRVTKSQI